MKILIEITHPAHVHFFRNAIKEFKARGHETAVTAREKDVTLQLLNNYGMDYTVLSRKGGSKFSLIGEMAVRDARLWKFCRRFKPDVLTGIGGVFAAHVGFAIRRPVIVWDDTEAAAASQRITYPFVSAVYSPDCYLKNMGKKQHFYPGSHELAYLHPNRFKPDAEIVKAIGINPSEKYCLIRFVSWLAHHDIGQHGFAREKKLEFVKEISKYTRPYISSEGDLPPELEPYRLRIPVHQIHHVMAFASLCAGEGATMAAESAVLGVPAVYINTIGAGTINMYRDYGLLRHTINTDEALKLSLEYLRDPQAKEKCTAARKKLLADKIDVTDYIVKVIEQVSVKS